MAPSMSLAPYTALPATSTSAPAATTWRAVTGSTPPSTSRWQAGLYWSIYWRMAAIFGSWSAMNFWPPKPGSTVITRIRSTSLM